MWCYWISAGHNPVSTSAPAGQAYCVFSVAGMQNLDP